MAVSWSGGLQGGLGGAGSGAAIGSMFGPIGTGIGAGAGGLLGLLGGLFSGGEKAGVKQAPNFNPEQQNILSLLLGQGMQGLQNPYSGFEDISNYATNQFNQNIIPSIAERFTSMGSNALTSGAFKSELGQAGKGLGDTLALLRNQYGQQNRQNALAQLGLGLSPAFQNFFQEETPGFGQRLLGLAAEAGPKFYQAHQLGNVSNALKALQNR